MKNMKKFFAVLLTLAMVLGMMTTALAATITVPDNGHTYEILQIFTGDLSENTLSNLKWGSNAQLPEGAKVGDAVPTSVITELENVKNSSDTAKLAVIKEYVKLDSNPIATVGAVDHKNLKATGLANGYYLVRDKAETVPETDADGKPVAEAYTLYLVKIVKDITISPKSDVPEVDKKVDDADANEAGIGDTVTYTLNGTLPSDIANYNTYFYKFNDNMSAGLTFYQPENIDDVAITVTVDGVDVSKYFYRNVGTYSETTGTQITVSIADLKALDCAPEMSAVNKKIAATSQVVVTYQAIVNDKAVVAPNANPNEVDLDYSNNPNDSGEPGTNPPGEPEDNEPTTEHPHGTTPKDEVKTYTTEVTIKKVDENGNVLTGAEFKLTGDTNKVLVKTTTKYVPAENGEFWMLKNGTYTKDAPLDDEYEDGWDASKDGAEEHLTKVNNHDDYMSLTQKYAPNTTTTTELMGNGETKNDIKAFVNAEGNVTFTGLGAGSYTITETKTPAGYNTIPNITFDITWNKEDGFAIDNAVNAEFDGDQTFTTTIVNQSGTVLPETGGMGTRLFYMIGGLLVVAAGVLLITKRRMATK